MLFKVVAGWNSGIMPPKADKAKKLSESSRPQVGAAHDDMSEILDAKFKSMLLNALRTDEEVKTTVAMILRSRETDVFSAVVQCLEKDNVKQRMGQLLHSLYFFSCMN